ncbi:MAG: glycosyltransferase [Chloroflexi bacterium]|nr:MAG: glycosyltransferase [Chloroflexota bacterium]MBL1197032.1 glycosyltransferase [Chloroflexota bacterium]NOH14327.1 glycosyltransferase [Chloroflexota bacterium]
MPDLASIFLSAILVFQVILVINVISNWLTLKSLDSYAMPDDWPTVSILLPARNEADNIKACVWSLLAQDYPNYEVIVLDDSSTDETPEILGRIKSKEPKLKLIKGESLPDGWLGKHWACQQLAEAAQHEYLVFTDADTRHAPHMLRKSVAATLQEDADLLSVIPKEETHSWAERLAMPIIPWSLHTFLPLWLSYRLPFSFLAAAIGQFILVRKSAYEQAGGHAAIRDNVVDDFALARRFKLLGLRWRLAEGVEYIRCRMYSTPRQVFEGLSKNLYAVFNQHAGRYLFVWSWLLIVFWAPLVMLLLELSDWPVLGVISIALALFVWATAYLRFGFPLYLVILYPITILAAAGIAYTSMLFSFTGHATWKGRRVKSLGASKP